jgi:hypothetical protein
MYARDARLESTVSCGSLRIPLRPVLVFPFLSLPSLFPSLPFPSLHRSLKLTTISGKLPYKGKPSQGQRQGWAHSCLRFFFFFHFFPARVYPAHTVVSGVCATPSYTDRRRTASGMWPRRAAAHSECARVVRCLLLRVSNVSVPCRRVRCIFTSTARFRCSRALYCCFRL